MKLDLAIENNGKSKLTSGANLFASSFVVSHLQCT